MAQKLYVDLGAPASLVITISTEDAGVDGTTVSAARIKVQRPDAEDEWDVDISSPAADSLVVTHEFVAADLPVSGRYKIYVECDVPGGTIRTETMTLTVYDRFGG